MSLLESEFMIDVKSLTKMFNDFVAADGISFDVKDRFSVCSVLTISRRKEPFPVTLVTSTS